MDENDKETRRLANALFDAVFKQKKTEPERSEPKLYRSRPVYVEAIQYNGHFDSLIDFVGLENITVERYKNFIQGTSGQNILIRTVVGDERLNVGDYVAKQPNGDILMANARDFETVFQPK